MKTCSRCGAENGSENLFCAKCGAALNVPQPAPAAPAAPETKKCPNCGAENGSENLFCAKCGTALNVPQPAPAAPAAPETKKCPNCGTENDSGNLFCAKCGTALNIPQSAPTAPREPQMKVCPSCGTANDSGYTFCQNCGASLGAYASQPAFQGNPVPPQPQPAMQQPTVQGGSAAQPDASISMGWHKFLIYFALWAGALVDVVNGVSLVIGDSAAFLSDRIMGYAQLCIGYCFVMIVMAVLCIVTRFKLAGFKRGGPAMLTGLYVANLVIAFLYVFVLYQLMRRSGFVLSPRVVIEPANFVAPIVMIIVNLIYYKKRAHLFVN